jgi:regulator of protease activity HflC (stomatin/prohibitin superfamily)
MTTTILAVIAGIPATENPNSFNWLLLVGILIGAFLILGFFLSWVTIQPNEYGWRTFFGSDGKVLKPGLNFSPWLLAKVVKYKSTALTFKIKVPSAMTKNGIVKDYKEDVGEIERTELDINLSLITYFDPKNLALTVKNAPGDNAKALGPIIESFVIDIFRDIVSEMPWPLFNGERTKVLDLALSKIIPEYKYNKIDFTIDQKAKCNVYFFKNDFEEIGEDLEMMMKKNPLVQFGLNLNQTSIRIEDVNFTNPDIAQSISLAEKARQEAEVTRISSTAEANKIKEAGQAEADVIDLKATAEANKTKKIGLAANEVSVDKIKKEGIASAEARKLMISEIKDNPDLEYLRTLEQMAKGTSNTILYQIPKAFEDKVSAIMGGSKPEDFFALLKDEKIATVLKEALEKLTKK